MKRLIILSLSLLVLLAPLSLVAQVPTVGNITNQTLATSSQEYKVILGRGVKAFSVQLRGSHDLRLAFVEGGTSAAYVTIKADSVATYYSPAVAWDGIIYLRCDQAGQVAEIEYWR